MNPATAFNLAFNAVGALLGLTVVGYIVYAALHKDTLPPCSTAYPPATRFSLQSSKGGPMSPSELQGRVGLHEWGVRENASVSAEGEVPGGAALDIKLAAVTDPPPEVARTANGVDFRWSPAGLAKAEAVCLTYKVWLPKGFAYGSGGLLPGISGGLSVASAAQPNDPVRFGSRTQWRLDGAGELAVATSGAGYQQLNNIGNRNRPLPKDQWTSVEQELVLNTPKEPNGVARLWIDGELIAESAALPLRKEASARFIGVLADIGYFQPPEKPSAIRISPFEIAWR
jgi:hypothetical protein